MQADVNIVYPIDGETYPKVDPSPGGKLSSAYLPFSFSTTCSGGGHEVRWGIGNTTLGKAGFYDEFSGQFLWKLPPGKHEFWVKSDCGKGSVVFKVG